MADNDSFPEYILNGVQSYRWVKPSSPSDTVMFDQSDTTCSVLACREKSCSSYYCSQDGCPPTTQAFYALTETGDVYVTTPNGVVFYLASDSDKDMKVVYPTNHLITVGKDPVPPSQTGISLGTVGKYGVQFGITQTPPPAELAETPSQVVRPEQPRVYPWRPGSDHCSESVVAFGERAGTVSSFIIGDPSGKHVEVRPKCYAGNSYGSKLVFPYTNGYYCVQTDYNRCVVFYRGEQIYNGEYNGQGISAPFGYGLWTCISTYGCNPVINESDITWSYSLYPEWQKTEDGHFVVTTPFDLFTSNRTIKDDNGKIIGSNILIRREDADGKFIEFDVWEGYYADDVECPQKWETLESKHRVTYTKDKKYKGIRDFLKRRDEDYEPGPGEYPCAADQRRFDIYKLDASTDTGLGECVGYVVVYVEQEHIVDEGRLAEVVKEITELTDLIRGYEDGLADVKDELQSLKDHDSGNPKIASLEALVEETKEKIKELRIKRSELEDEEMEIRGPEKTEDCVTGEFHEVIRFTDEKLQNDINDHQRQYRVWWWPKEDEIRCGLYADERIGVPSYACNYHALFRCDEKQHYTYHNTENDPMPMPYATPKHYYWYVGNGLSEGRDTNFHMSRWREELCVSCDMSEGNVDGGPPCPCLEQIRTGYTSDNNCLFQNHATENAAICGKCNYPVDLNAAGNAKKTRIEEPCWKHSVGCPPEKEDGDKTTYKLAHYCQGAIGRVDLENLGGRIHSVFYQDGTESAWAYVTKGEPACRTKKDYTIVGEIAGPEDLPGIYNFNRATSETKDQFVDVSGANAVILRAPADKCKPVTVDGKEVCEGDITVSSTKSFPRGNDWLVRRTITNKKTKKVKCFNFYEIDPINGFADGVLDGKGFDTGAEQEEEQGTESFPCISNLWVVNAKVTKKNENNQDQEVDCTFRIPKDSHGNGRGDYAQVEVTAVERTVRKETVKGDRVDVSASGSTIYTWSLNEVGKENPGISYEVHGRTFLHHDTFWGSQTVTDDYNSTFTSGYVKIASLIDWDGDDSGLDYLAKGEIKEDSQEDDQENGQGNTQGVSQEVIQTAFSGVEEGLVSFTKVVADKVAELAREQTQADERAFWDDGVFATDCIWYRDLTVKAENDPSIEWKCRAFAESFTKREDNNEGNSWGYSGLPFFATVEYGPCASDLYQEFSRSNFSNITLGCLETSITIINYGSGYNEEPVTYTAKPITQTTAELPEWQVNGKKVSEENQISWSPTTSRHLANNNDKGLVKGVTHYRYDDTKEDKKNDGQTEIDTKFDVDFSNAVDYEITNLTYTTYDDHQQRQHSRLTFTENITITGNFQVTFTLYSDDDVTDPDPKKSDLKEVRYKFLHFYPAYLTRPDYYFRLNDAEKDIPEEDPNDERSYLERLEEWQKITDYKAGDSHNSDKNFLPSANPNATCTTDIHHRKFTYSDGFYDYQHTDYEFGITDFDPEHGYAQNRPEYTESTEWRFVGYEHEGEEDEDSFYNGDIRWYAKWQRTDDEDVIVRIPFPKPQGRCFHKTVRHLSRVIGPKPGVWYCTGPAGNEHDALTNYLGSEIEIINDGDATQETEPILDDETDGDDTAVENPDAFKLDRNTVTSYDEFSGIKWVQAVYSWGDPEGTAIRAGSMVGDIYYRRTEESVNEDHDENDSVALEDFVEGSDRYWYWNGAQWVDGDNYISSLGTEKVIFYKNEGKLQEIVGKEKEKKTGRSITGKTIKEEAEVGEDCDTAKAIFVGYAESLKACGNILAVNLGKGLERHAAIFYKAKPLWDRPASHDFDHLTNSKYHYYTDNNGKKMEELMVCVCNAFTMLTYSIGTNKQVFRLWANAAETEKGFEAVYSYEDVPDLTKWKDTDCEEGSSIRRDADGNMVYPDYMVLHSRSSGKLYLFYKNKLIHTYKRGEWVDGILATLQVGSLNRAGARGPNVMAILTGKGNAIDLGIDEVFTATYGRADIWKNGSLYKKAQDVAIYGDGYAVGIRGERSGATLLTDAGLELGYDYLQLTGGGTFVVPLNHGPKKYADATGGYLVAIPDAPALVGHSDGQNPNNGGFYQGTNQTYGTWSCGDPIRCYRTSERTVEEYVTDMLGIQSGLVGCPPTLTYIFSKADVSTGAPSIYSYDGGGNGTIFSRCGDIRAAYNAQNKRVERDGFTFTVTDTNDTGAPVQIIKVLPDEGSVERELWEHYKSYTMVEWAAVVANHGGASKCNNGESGDFSIGDDTYRFVDSSNASFKLSGLLSLSLPTISTTLDGRQVHVLSNEKTIFHTIPMTVQLYRFDKNTWHHLESFGDLSVPEPVIYHPHVSYASGKAVAVCEDYGVCSKYRVYYNQYDDQAYLVKGFPIEWNDASITVGSTTCHLSILGGYFDVANPEQSKPWRGGNNASICAVVHGPTGILGIIPTNICHGVYMEGEACLGSLSIEESKDYDKYIEDTGENRQRPSVCNYAAEVDNRFVRGQLGDAIFWTIDSGRGIVLRIKNGTPKLSYELTPLPCDLSNKKLRCGKYTIVVKTENTIKKYSLYYQGRSIFTDKKASELRQIHTESKHVDDLVFAACCASSNSTAYAVLNNGWLFYEGSYIATVSPSVRLNCCGKAVLISDFRTNQEQGVSWTMQILLIDGKPVSPFLMHPDESGEDGETLEEYFTRQARWEQIQTAFNEPVYDLSCCGIDYYLLQRGNYTRIHEPTVAWTEDVKTEQNKHPITTYTFSIDQDPSKTYGILEDGTRVILEEIQTIKFTDTYSHPNDEGDKVIDYEEKYVFEYPLKWTTRDKEKLYDVDMSPLTQDEYEKKFGEDADSAVFTEDGVEAAVSFFHDVDYEIIDTGSDDAETHEIKQSVARFVPWKTVERMNYRETFVYYKTSLISTDPRIKEIHCFRYENMGSYNIPEYHGIAAYATFYDDPFTDCYEQQEFKKSEKKLDGDTSHKWDCYTERQAVQNILGVAKVHKGRNAKERVLVNTAPPHMEMEYIDEDFQIHSNDPPSCTCFRGDDAEKAKTEDINASNCFCAGKGRMTSVYPNVCCIVWHKARCMTRLKSDAEKKIDVHKNDTPHTPFWDGTAWDGTMDEKNEKPSAPKKMYPGIRGDKTIVDYRNDVIYINDLNAAGRWDRISGDDPVDEWVIEWPGTTEVAGFGEFWVSAPDYHPEQVPGEPLDPNGRLIVSGNNTLFVFDKKYGMMAYDILTGKRIRFK